MKLSEVKLKKTVEITAIHLEDLTVRRLYSLGLFVGAKVYVERFSLLKSSMLVYTKNKGVVIRVETAERIEVRYE